MNFFSFMYYNISQSTIKVLIYIQCCTHETTLCIALKQYWTNGATLLKCGQHWSEAYRQVEASLQFRQY